MRYLVVDNSKPNRNQFTLELLTALKVLCGDTHTVVHCTTCEETIREVQQDDVDGVFLSGSSMNLSQPNTIQILKKNTSTLLRLGRIPVLGICFGMQLICTLYGGKVARLVDPVEEVLSLSVKPGSVLFKRMRVNTKVTLSHQDYVCSLPLDFKSFSEYKGRHMVVENETLFRFGVQFHPERTVPGETECVLRNFLDFTALVKPRVYRDLYDAVWLLQHKKSINVVKKAYPSIPIEVLMSEWRRYLHLTGNSAIMI